VCCQRTPAGRRVEDEQITNISFGDGEFIIICMCGCFLWNGSTLVLYLISNINADTYGIFYSIGDIYMFCGGR